MRLIYNANFTDLAPKPDGVAITREYAVGYEIDSFAVYGISGNVTVQGSNDNFASTPYDSGLLSVDSIVTITPVTYAKWRIVASAGVTIGDLFIGNLITIKQPTYPYSFELQIDVDSRRSKGGTRFSKINFKKHVANMSWKLVADTELQDWRAWYEATDGFTKGFLVEEPLKLTMHIMVGLNGTSFPLSFIRFNDHSGRLKLIEL